MSTKLVTPTITPNPPAPDHETIYANVQNHYSSTTKPTTNDSSYGTTVASAFGYPLEDLIHAPSESNLGLSCGNPLAIANLREGETVVDLGSGAGFDVFQAARKVGSAGRVVGVDMNKEMLAKATTIKSKTNTPHVHFLESRITAIDIPSATADCVISNCVINLVPTDEKQLAFNEMHRILKPSGRVAISDILLKRDLPTELKSNVALYVGCVAGASRVEEYELYLRRAGFGDVLIVPDHSDLNVYRTASKDSNAEVGCCGPAGKAKSSGCGTKDVVEDAQLADVDLNEWAGSFKIYAVKSEG